MPGAASDHLYKKLHNLKKFLQNFNLMINISYYVHIFKGIHRKKTDVPYYAWLRAQKDWCRIKSSKDKSHATPLQILH